MSADGECSQLRGLPIDNQAQVNKGPPDYLNK